MTAVPVVKIVPADPANGDSVEINATDYNPDIHTLVEGEEVPGLREAERKVLIEKAIVAGRTHLAKLSDDDLRRAAGLEFASAAEPTDEADDGTGGLTKPEIIADLTAMEVEHDPRAKKADLLALRNEARAIRDA